MTRTFETQRGAVAITLDRPRFIFFDMAATGLLIERFGMNIAAELYSVHKTPADLDIRLRSADNLAAFLHAGLQCEAAQRGETLSLEEAEDFIRPVTVRPIFAAVMQAFLVNTVTPELPEAGKPGKAQPKPKRGKRVSAKNATPGPLVSISTRHKGSR